MLRVDRELSLRLRVELSSYLSAAVDDGESLVCRSADDCRRSVRTGELLVEGQLSHVGSCFAIEDDDRPLRILVVPKQVGGSLEHGKGRGEQHVSVERRSAQVESAKFGARPHPRTDHMVGTALALKVILGLPVVGPETVYFAGEQAHVFDCYAMANSTLCSRVGADAAGQGSPTMFERCVVHLRRTIEILQPRVVMAQGWNQTGWSPSRVAADALGVRKPKKNSCVPVATRYGQVALVAAVHPARNWFTPAMPSWRSIERVLREARAIALG